MYDLLVRLALALAIGLVVGVERGWHERAQPEGGRVAGVRTFTLIGLAGGVAVALAQAMDAPFLVAVVMAAVVAPLAWFKHVDNVRDGDVGMTTVVAGTVVFLLGALAVAGDLRAAAAGGVVAAIVLAVRESAHRFVKRLTWDELKSGLLLLAMTAVILPLLPDRAFDPYGVINPRSIWLLTVLTAAISYAGYIAMKVMGPARGPIVAGVVGGLVSSTAVCIAFARRSREGEPAAPLAAGILWAATVSAARVALLAAVVFPPLLPMVAPGAGGVVIGLAAGALVSHLRAPVEGGAPTLGDPFELKSVLGFALLLTVVGFLSGWAGDLFHEVGVYAVAVLSGLADVDAVTLSNARLARAGEPLATASIAILLALLSNNVLRVVYAGALGVRPLAVRVAIGVGLGIIGGALGLAGGLLIAPQWM